MPPKVVKATLGGQRAAQCLAGKLSLPGCIQPPRAKRGTGAAARRPELFCSIERRKAGKAKEKIEFEQAGAYNRRKKSHMLTLHHVTKTYGKGHLQVDALRDVELQVDTGEFVAVIGPSGSGKTTLMNILGCLDDPTQGEYLLDGVPVGRLSGREKAVLRNREIGFVFQSFNLVSSLTAQENVELPLVFRGMEGEKRRELSRLALEQVGLSRRAHHRPWELSGGQQQRVAIARAIAAHPPLILADEPTGNLDSKSTENVMEYLVDINRKFKITLVMVTHDSYAASFCDKVILLKDGIQFLEIEKNNKSNSTFLKDIYELLKRIGGE